MDSIIRKMAMIKCCPFCGQQEPITIEMCEEKPIFYVNCSPQKGGCGATGPICYRMDYAIDAWNDRERGEK